MAEAAQTARGAEASDRGGGGLGDGSMGAGKAVVKKGGPGSKIGAIGAGLNFNPAGVVCMCMCV